MQWIVLVPIISTLVYAGPPVFTNYPVSHSKATSFRDEINICGTTNGIDDEVYWELFDEETREFRVVSWESCISVPSGLGITSIDMMGEDRSITYRVCASNDDGRTCASESKFTVVKRLRRLSRDMYKRTRHHRGTRL